MGVEGGEGGHGQVEVGFGEEFGVAVVAEAVALLGYGKGGKVSESERKSNLTSRRRSWSES